MTQRPRRHWPGLEVAGTIAYMSPEQLEGGQGDAQSDIFAFGVLLQEMLTGVHPYRRSSPAATASAILTEETPAMSDRHPACPVRSSTSWPDARHGTVTQRYHTAREIRADLAAVLEGSSVPAPRAGMAPARGPAGGVGRGRAGAAAHLRMVPCRYARAGVQRARLGGHQRLRQPDGRSRLRAAAPGGADGRHRAVTARQRAARAAGPGGAPADAAPRRGSAGRRSRERDRGARGGASRARREHRAGRRRARADDARGRSGDARGGADRDRQRGGQGPGAAGPRRSRPTDAQAARRIGRRARAAEPVAAARDHVVARGPEPVRRVAPLGGTDDAPGSVCCGRRSISIRTSRSPMPIWDSRCTCRATGRRARRTSSARSRSSIG
jgi:hypothetical protein